MTQATTNSLPPLAKPETLATWLGLQPDDPLLVAALAAASARFRGAVRHPVSFIADDEVVLDGTGTPSLLLPAAPVTALHNVTLDGEDITEQCSWSTDGRIRHQCGVFPDGLGNVHVTYDHGYADIPDEISEVVIDQARAMHSVRPGVSQVQTSVESVSFGSAATIGVTAQWSAVVEAYKLNRGDRC